MKKYEEGQRGSVKIGRTGTKLHPAVIMGGSVMICCSCPNVMNGWANHKATFFPNVVRTCGVPPVSQYDHKYERREEARLDAMLDARYANEPTEGCDA